MKVEVTSVSSKGQVVIPAPVRKQLGLATGSKLMIMTDGTNVLMRPIRAPRREVFAQLVDESRAAAAASQLQAADLEQIIAEVRSDRRR